MYVQKYAKKYFFRNINQFLKFPGGFCSRVYRENVTGSKNTRFRKKKKSQELKTFAPPKIDRLVPYMCGPSDQILEGSFLMVFRDFFFFPKFFDENGPKLKIFGYIFVLQGIGKNTKLLSVYFFACFFMLKY